MENRLQKYAPIGLYIAGLALLVAAGAYILQRQFTLVVQISLGVAVIGLAANIILDTEGVRQALTGRQARYGSNALVLSLAFLGIVIVANYLAYQNDQRWDLTENQENSLAPETLDTIEKLPESVQIFAFFSSQNLSRTTAEDLFKLFVQSSDKKISYEMINPDANPDVAARAGYVRGTNRDGDILLYMGDRKEEISTANEQAMTGALIRLISGKTNTVYFLSGHGEYDPMSAGERSYSQVRRILEGKNYRIQTLNLLTVSAIPVDADVLVIAGPRKPLSENEVSLVQEYVGNGGKLLALLDPTISMEMGSSNDPLVDYLGRDLGIVVNDDLIIDLIGQQQWGQPLMAVGASYGSHPIGRGVGNFATLFPEARSLSIQESAVGVSPQMVVSTTEQSWGETDIEAILAGNQTQPDQDVDTFGPLYIMVAVENFTSQGRVLVVGDSDFAGDEFINALGNADLFVNSLDWVAGQEDLIQLTPKANTQRTLNLPPVPYLTGLIILVSVFVLPGSVLAIGIGVAISRKRRN
jgi:ABC-type uncharacterized transport system involved in gliding motility auxiliary subunit